MVYPLRHTKHEYAPPRIVWSLVIQVLDLTSNALQGHIPESLGEITNLRELWLGYVYS